LISELMGALDAERCRSAKGQTGCDHFDRRRARTGRCAGDAGLLDEVGGRHAPPGEAVAELPRAARNSSNRWVARPMAPKRSRSSTSTGIGRTAAMSSRLDRIARSIAQQAGSRSTMD
jgi:hypothetical protein